MSAKATKPARKNALAKAATPVALPLLADLRRMILQARESGGGFNANPLMFQFGYQFEVQYLNQGSFQALFEFIPMITGLDQGKFLPSISVLNGMRSNISGW